MNRKQGTPETGASLPCGNLLIGVTGSVGALNVPLYLFLFRKSFAKEIHVMMSQAAQKFLRPYALRMLSGNPVFTDTFEVTNEVRVPHIELTRSAELFLIMPATANIIGKAANGICDDLISTSITACRAPIVFVPSMNEVMWTNITVQQNIQRLKVLGHHVIEPAYGYEVSDMEQAYGVMPSFASLLDQLTSIFARTGSRLVTALDSA